jgi:Tol biopolymer transport system component
LTAKNSITAATAILLFPLYLGAQKPPKAANPPNPAIAYESQGTTWYYDLSVMDADGTNQVRLVRGGDNLRPSWSPDGEWIAFARSAIASPGIYVIRPDGTGLCRIVPTSGLPWHGAPSWSPTPAPDGNLRIVYGDQLAGETQPDLFAITAECGATDRQQLTDTPGVFEGSPAWSSDGRLAAFVDGDIHVFDVAFDVSGAMEVVDVATLTSTGPLAGAQVFGPSWTADGTELLVSAMAELWIISATTPGVASQLTSSSELFEQRATWSPDRSRIAFDAGGVIYTASIFQPWTLSEPAVLLGSKRTAFRNPSWRPTP